MAMPQISRADLDVFPYFRRMFFIPDVFIPDVFIYLLPFQQQCISELKA